MTKYNVRPLVAQEIEISTGTMESDKRETQLFDSLAASELIRQLNK